MSMDESIVKKYGNKAKMELLSIFEECLKEGYAKGREDCSEAKVKGYYEGFQQLWDCFRNYTEMNQEDKFKAVGYINFQELFDNLTPTWFVDKIKQFDGQKKVEEEIKVGSIIERKSDQSLSAVAAITPSGAWHILHFFGGTEVILKENQTEWENTQKRVDIEGILKSIGEK